jgi:oxygen-independent coproporphyrinogen-3 oxidase
MKIHGDVLSLYLHIPFCGTRCTYCAFNTYTGVEALIPVYVAAMCCELHWLGQATPHPIHTIFFGGGTPSLLAPEQVAQILATCRRAFCLLPEAEITLEANPGSIDRSYLDKLRETGVNRLSVGMQSAHAGELKLFARRHGVEAVVETALAARAAGFDNLSLDLIYGVPHQTLDMWRESVGAALALQPDHVSPYALTLEPGTPMARDVALGRLPTPDDDLAADMYEAADALLSAAGLVQYEISNWARPGYECRHNLQYWRNAPYLGVGAGAHGYAAGIRYEVVRPIRRYIELAESQHKSLPFPLTATVERHERIDLPDQMAEHMLTGLRLVREGVSTHRFQERFGVPIDSVYRAPLEKFAGYDLLRRDRDRILLAPQARLLSNQIFVDFMP